MQSGGSIRSRRLPRSGGLSRSGVVKASNLAAWRYFTIVCHKGPVAQWLEQSAHNRLVLGSIPSGPTNTFFDIFEDKIGLSPIGILAKLNSRIAFSNYRKV